MSNPLSAYDFVYKAMTDEERNDLQKRITNIMVASSQVAVETMSDKPTHTPEPLYSCHLCAEDACWPAGDLNWCKKCAQWMCDLCWDYEEHGEKGIRLDHHLMKGIK